jgi:hypothetical protein
VAVARALSTRNRRVLSLSLLQVRTLPSLVMTSNRARHELIQLPTIIKVRLLGTRRQSGTVPGTVPDLAGDGDAPPSESDSEFPIPIGGPRPEIRACCTHTRRVSPISRFAANRAPFPVSRPNHRSGFGNGGPDSDDSGRTRERAHESGIGGSLRVPRFPAKSGVGGTGIGDFRACSAMACCSSPKARWGLRALLRSKLPGTLPLNSSSAAASTSL